ncbi:MAG: TetR/AcrR family transcriptional regulator [Alphaproteobacteria bacterium]
MGHSAARKTGLGEARRKRLPKEEREKQILHKAVEMFAAQGFDGVSMNDIAEACGVTKPILYSHFGSKEGLFAAAMQEVARDLASALVEVLHEPDPANRLKQVANACLDEMARVHGQVPALQGAVGGANYGSLIVQQLDHYRDEIVGAMLEALLMMRPKHLSDNCAQPIAEYYAHLLHGAALETGLWWAETQALSLTQIKDKAARYIDAVIILVEQDMAAAEKEDQA